MAFSENCYTTVNLDIAVDRSWKQAKPAERHLSLHWAACCADWLVYSTHTHTCATSVHHWLDARVVLICNSAAAAAAAAQSLTSNAAQMIATASSCGYGSMLMWRVELAWCFFNFYVLDFDLHGWPWQEPPTAHGPVVDRFVVLSLRQTRRSDASDFSETRPDVALYICITAACKKLLSHVRRYYTDRQSQTFTEVMRQTNRIWYQQ